MKQTFVLIVLVLIGKFSYLQIESNLLLGLTQLTTVEISALSNPTMGSLAHNSTDFSIHQYTGSQRVRIFDSANNNTAETKLNLRGGQTTTDTITESNVENFVTNLFSTEYFKDKGNTLYKGIGNTFIAKDDSSYDIRATHYFINVKYVISVVIHKAESSGTVFLNGVRESNFMINKLKQYV